MMNKLKIIIILMLMLMEVNHQNQFYRNKSMLLKE